jgi:hypothetical protein
LDLLGLQLSIQDPRDWLKVPARTIHSNGGSSLLQHHGNSLRKLLSFVYPEYTWQPNRVSFGHWDDIHNQRAFFDTLGQELGVKHPTDWYNIRTVDVLSKAAGLINGRWVTVTTHSHT